MALELKCKVAEKKKEEAEKSLIRMVKCKLYIWHT